MFAHAKPLGGLTLGEAVVVDAVLRHDARSLLGQRAPDIITAYRSGSCHWSNLLWSVARM